MNNCKQNQLSNMHQQLKKLQQQDQPEEQHQLQPQEQQYVQRLQQQQPQVYLLQQHQHHQQQHPQNNHNSLMTCSKAEQLPPLMSQKVIMPMDEAHYTITTHSSTSNQMKSNQNNFGNILSNNITGISHDQRLSSYRQQYDDNLLMSYIASYKSQQGDYASHPPTYLIPDLSKPPPGFEEIADKGLQQDPSDDVLVPTLPYYQLPAGLIMPLIHIEDYNYKPIDPKDIRLLPPPETISERLSAAIESFYSPSDNRPRDSDGWEKKGLQEFFKEKNAAKKHKEEEIISGLRAKSPSPTLLELDTITPK